MSERPLEIDRVSEALERVGSSAVRATDALEVFRDAAERARAGAIIDQIERTDAG